MSTTLFTLPSDFSFVIAAACGATMILHLSGLLTVYGRMKFFGKERIETFMHNTTDTEKQPLSHPDDEKKKIEKPLPRPVLGYPDDGQGKIGRSLDYGSWFQFNRLHRGYLNYTEQLIFTIFTIIVGGIARPRWAAWSGLAILVGRLVYFIGYAYSTHGLVMTIGEIIALLAIFFNWILFLVFFCMSF